MQLVAQRRGFDCGIACASMIAHVDYADAFFVAAKIVGQNLRTGITLGELSRITARLGRPLKKVHFRKVDLDEDAGILGILFSGPSWKAGHWVVLRRGTIIDPDKSSVWDADEYMKFHEARPGWLLSES